MTEAVLTVKGSLPDVSPRLDARSIFRTYQEACMSDVILMCVDCGQPFEWTYGEQRFYREHNLHQPTHCHACREQRRRARDAGMRSEVGPLASFSADEEQEWERLSEPAQSAPVHTPDLPPARPPQPSHRPTPAPRLRPAPPAWWQGIDLLRIAAFVWVVVTLVVYRQFGGPAAVIVGGAGVVIAIWRFAKG
jgi:hypothetical protein